MFFPRQEDHQPRAVSMIHQGSSHDLRVKQQA
jgi:hypothetical protein